MRLMTLGGKSNTDTEMVPVPDGRPMPSKNLERGHPPISYFRLMLDHGYIPSDVREYRYARSGTETDPFLVEWTKNDPRNPMNTKQWRKWSWTSLQSLATFALTFTTSGYSAGPDEIYARFRPSTEIC